MDACKSCCHLKFSAVIIVQGRAFPRTGNQISNASYWTIMDTLSFQETQMKRANFLARLKATLCNVSFPKISTKKSTSQTTKAFAIWISMKEIQPTFYKRYALAITNCLVSIERRCTLNGLLTFSRIKLQPFIYIIKLIKWTVKLLAWAIIQTSLLPVDASDMGMDYDTGKIYLKINSNHEQTN